MKLRMISLISVLLTSLTLTSSPSPPMVENPSSLSVFAEPFPTRIAGAFFYPWYSGPPRYRHWTPGNHTPPANWASNYLPDVIPDIFDPTKELYDSNSTDTILMQIGMMKAAGIRLAISSWWGPNSFEDKVFRNILLNVANLPNNPYRNLKWSIYYEPEVYGDPSTETLVSELEYIISSYASSPNFFKIGGRNVIFVYGGANDTADYARRWAEVRTRLPNIFIVLKVFLGYESYAGLADSWHKWAPHMRYGVNSPFSAFISPGFWKYDESARLERNLTDFESALSLLVEGIFSFILVETWNDWNEGTQVEPGQPIDPADGDLFVPASSSYGSSYLDVLSKYLKPLLPLPVEIRGTTPSVRAYALPVNVEVEARSPYTTATKAYVSIDGQPFQELGLVGQIGDYSRYMISLRMPVGIHDATFFAVDEFNNFSDNLSLTIEIVSMSEYLPLVLVTAAIGFILPLIWTVRKYRKVVSLSGLESSSAEKEGQTAQVAAYSIRDANRGY